MRTTLFLSAMLPLVAGCATTLEHPDRSDSGVPPALDVSGEWRSNWGPLWLTQQGTSVTGNYYENRSGALKGYLHGYELKFKWSESLMGGSGSFSFSKDNRSFTGGFQQLGTNAWSGVRVGEPPSPAPVQSVAETVPAATGGAISKADLQAMVRQAVKDASHPEGSSALSSDVDRPGYRLGGKPRDFALVVGIERYSDIPEAQFAERDAEAVKEHLLALGVPSRNLVLLTGPKAVRSAMEKYLESWLPRNVEEDSRVYFYFSGHGAPDIKTGRSYLVPWDGDPDFLDNTGYPVERLYEKLSALKAREVVVAMDACFSGAGGRSVLAKGARPLVMRADAAVVPRKLTVFAAAGGDQITSTLADQGHGAFTYYFLKGLSGGAKGSSGTVTARGLHEFLKPQVQDAARRQNRDQEPILHAEEDRELVRF